jgi:hypothetical protein
LKEEKKTKATNIKLSDFQVQAIITAIRCTGLSTVTSLKEQKFGRSVNINTSFIQEVIFLEEMNSNK